MFCKMCQAFGEERRRIFCVMLILRSFLHHKGDNVCLLAHFFSWNFTKDLLGKGKKICIY